MVDLAFVADDFTGATDALWQLQRFGLRGRLLTGLPADGLPDVTGLDVLGVATTARSAPGRGSADVALPVLQALAGLRPRVLQYKVCSTFDSAPDRGSIGAVVEAWRAESGDRRAVPVLPAQPELGRWTVFSQHFARYAGQVHRLDRHEPMRHHPATPVDEADLRLHLGRQLEGTVGELPVPVLDDDALPGAVGTALAGGDVAFVVDALHEADLVRFGAALREQVVDGEPLLVVGSGGFSYGWAAAQTGWAAPAASRSEVSPPSGPVLAISGSASPVTDQQITRAEQAGWASIGLHEDDVWERVRAALTQRRNAVVWTARGRADRDPTGLSARLGALAAQAADEVGLARLLVAGGDTSGEVLREAGVQSLEILGSLDVAGLLCRAGGAGSHLDGCEVVLKGGQIGGEDFFLRVSGEAPTSTSMG